MISKPLDSYHLLWTSNKINLRTNNIYKYLPYKPSLLLLNDGSFTKILESLTNQTMQFMLARNYKKHFNDQDNYHNATELKTHRQGWLTDKAGRKLLLANSWYKPEILKNRRLTTAMPLGKMFINSELIFYRKLRNISCFCSKWFEQQFHAEGYIWSREYILYHKKSPFIFIQEFFSPKLTKCWNKKI